MGISQEEEEKFPKKILVIFNFAWVASGGMCFKKVHENVTPNEAL